MIRRKAQASRLRSVSPSALFPPSHRWVCQVPSPSRSDLGAGSILEVGHPVLPGHKTPAQRRLGSPQGVPAALPLDVKALVDSYFRARWSWRESNPHTVLAPYLLSTLHAPHALFTPSTGGTTHGPRTPGLNPTRSIHNTILCSGRHGQPHDLLHACRGVRDRRICDMPSRPERPAPCGGSIDPGRHSSPVPERAASGRGRAKCAPHIRRLGAPSARAEAHWQSGTLERALLSGEQQPSSRHVGNLNYASCWSRPCLPEPNEEGG